MIKKITDLWPGLVRYTDTGNDTPDQSQTRQPGAALQGAGGTRQDAEDPDSEQEALLQPNGSP